MSGGITIDGGFPREMTPELAAWLAEQAASRQLESSEGDDS